MVEDSTVTPKKRAYKQTEMVEGDRQYSRWECLSEFAGDIGSQQTVKSRHDICIVLWVPKGIHIFERG